MDQDSEYRGQAPDETQRIVEEAAHWIMSLDDADEQECAAFVRWLRVSRRHVEEFLQMSVIVQDLSELETTEAVASPDPDQPLVPFLATLAKTGRPEHALYVRYRLPVLRVLLQRGIKPDAAQGLLQQIFVRVIKKFRGDKDELNLSRISECLYQVSCDLAHAYARQRLRRQTVYFPDEVMGLSEEALSLEERLDDGLLSKSVRSLLRRLPDPGDREILTRFYMQEESRSEICRALGLTFYQFNQALFRARQRFAEILRQQGFDLPDPGADCLKKTYRAALYVADDLDSPRKQRFEMHMIKNSCCNHEVDVWSTIKRHMPRAKTRKTYVD